MTALPIVDRPSPNFGTRPSETRVDILLLHYTGMKSAAESLDRLCDPAANVSAHYLIDEAGTVFRASTVTPRPSSMADVIPVMSWLV